MKRNFTHTRTISRLAPDAFEETTLGVETARVLILGTECTGKSSIFKQLRRYCGDHPVSRQELEAAKPHCVEHILRVAKYLTKRCIELRMSGDESIVVRKENEQLIVKYSTLSFSLIDQYSMNGEFHEEQYQKFWKNVIGMEYNSEGLMQQLRVLFSDPGIIRTYGMCQPLVINNASWFLKRMFSYFDENFIPTFDDYVRLQSKVGVFDEVSKLSQTWNLSITDLSGKRSQRTLWSSVIDNKYTAMLFVASLADFDRFNTINTEKVKPTADMKKDDNNNFLLSNKLIESMELLQNLVGLSYFENTNIILILNEKDVFDEKLTKFGISFVKKFPIYLADRFSHKNRGVDYKDNIYHLQNTIKNNKDFEKKTSSSAFNLQFDETKEFDPNYCIQYIKTQFTNILPDNLQKTLRIYITCAIATDTFHYVLQTLTQEIIHMEQLRQR